MLRKRLDLRRKVVAIRIDNESNRIVPEIGKIFKGYVYRRDDHNKDYFAESLGAGEVIQDFGIDPLYKETN